MPDDGVSFLQTVIFRPAYAQRHFGQQIVTDRKDSRQVLVDVTATNDRAPCTSSSVSTSERFWKKWKLKGFSIEDMNFERWLVVRTMQMVFVSQTVLDVLARMGLDKKNPQSIVNTTLRRCFAKSMINGIVMATNIGCIVIAVTQYASWRGQFSLWTVPCATVIIPTIFSRPLGVKSLDAVKGGLMLGGSISVAFFVASVFYDLSINETYERLRKDVEINLKEKKELEQSKHMEKH